MSYFVVISAHNQGFLTNIVNLYVALPSKDRPQFASLAVGLMRRAVLQSEKPRTRLCNMGGKHMLVGVTYAGELMQRTHE